jgi:hypothetical protein
MLGKVFARFVEKSHIAVMVRGTLERVLGAEQLDTWFARTAQKQYTRTVLFSTVYDNWEHSVILTFPVAALGTVQTPDPVYRCTWHNAGLTCDYCSPHTTTPRSA